MRRGGGGEEDWLCGDDAVLLLTLLGCVREQLQRPAQLPELLCLGGWEGGAEE